ncbi:hypothetical protein ACFWFI_04410 [Streptomyces sp. NPDC060209]|uniref:hypothetical protein n=1 Tax=Streptomyces sp. NPDC060209 TaxID=3347073 RepID=UPI0036605E30
MMKKSSWGHPRWNLTIVVPLLIFVIVEDDVITRCLAAVALTLAAVRYGHESAKRTSVKAALPLTSAPDNKACEPRRPIPNVDD